MNVADSLRAAFHDFYDQSWRLFLLNTALSVVAILVVWTALYTPLALVLIFLLGPLAAALMHCAVRLVREDELHLSDAVEGLALHWRRGLALAALAIAAGVLTFVAIRFYAAAGTLAWPLAVLALYLALLFLVFQLPLWPLAVLEHDRPFRVVLADAFTALLRRPAGSVGLALALLVVNVVGAAAALVPFLTLTIAYSFLAAAHFVLPRVLREG